MTNVRPLNNLLVMSTRFTLKQGQLHTIITILRQFREIEKTAMTVNYELKNDIFFDSFMEYFIVFKITLTMGS